MTVNGSYPDENGDVKVDLSGIGELGDKVDRLGEAVSEESRRAVGAEEALGGSIAAETARAQAEERGLRSDVSSAQSAISDRYTKSETDAKIAAAAPGDYGEVKGRVAALEEKVPEQASGRNQLADKSFVNSSIATNTAFYISDGGSPFRSLADLESYAGALTNNDYAFVVGMDGEGNTTYTRYKWSEATGTWAEEYVLNNSSFTASQWEAISSGITSGLVSKIRELPTAEDLATDLANKADKATTLAGYGITDAATKDEVALKSDKVAVDPLLFAQYYPDGNVKSSSELTSGIKYDAPDTASRTITVKPFCFTGDSANDNSGLVGRVVIPPFVDGDGNPYVSDDGTRYMVVGVGSGYHDGSNENLSDIVVPNTVTGIGNRAFCSCLALTSVSLPSATSIGYEAFFQCIALTSVSLPSATSIGVAAFFDCSSLTYVSLPSATRIGDNALRSVPNLESVDFGGTPRPSVPTFGHNAISGVSESCKIIVPYAQYGAWIAADGWKALPQEFVRHSEKADKPAAFTTGNLAALDANGNPTDSGKKPGDFQPKLSDGQLANIAAVPDKVGSFASVGGASATVENGVAKLSDFFTESNSLLTGTIDAEVISKGTAPDAHLEAPTDERLKLVLADNSVAYDSAKALPYKLTSAIGDRVVATMTLTAASTDITLPAISANDTTAKDFILDVTNAYAVEGVATDAGINIPRTDFKLVTRDGESLTAVTTVKAGKSAFICFTQKSPVVVDGTTYPCWCVIQLPFGDPS